MSSVKKSAVVAFLELLKSVEAGDEVLILRSSDQCANAVVQEYNDELHNSNDEDSPWQTFVDRLAEKFANVPDTAGSEPWIPEKEATVHLATMLVQIKNKVLHPTA
jgi:antitoxin (DNA-binding transcriptional repressor) of toxin-antitoxin stability system